MDALLASGWAGSCWTAPTLWGSSDPEDPFIVLGDPEGNEFCVVRHREPDQ